MSSLLSALRDLVHGIPSTWDLRQSKSQLFLADPAQCPLFSKTQSGTWSALIILLIVLSLWYSIDSCLSPVVRSQLSDVIYKTEAAWGRCVLFHLPHMAPWGRCFMNACWVQWLLSLSSYMWSFMNVVFTLNQLQINRYVVWNKNKWILFYLHCLIFVWGFLPSFSSAVVKFCFNFCHYHKQHPLLIIWVEDAAS